MKRLMLVGLMSCMFVEQVFCAVDNNVHSAKFNKSEFVTGAGKSLSSAVCTGLELGALGACAGLLSGDVKKASVIGLTAGFGGRVLYDSLDVLKLLTLGKPIGFAEGTVRDALECQKPPSWNLGFCSARLLALAFLGIHCIKK